MKIIETYNWYRRDFSYDAECEHCGHIEKHTTGYDDSNYYNNVVPDMKCDKCGESSKSKPTTAPKEVILPRHNPNAII